MEEESQINDDVCNEVVDNIIAAISKTETEGYDQYRTVDLLFERIIEIYRYFDFPPEEVVKAVYERYEIDIQ